MGMDAFTKMAKDEKAMKKFVKTTVDYLKRWNFDGLGTFFSRFFKIFK
jgi:GH18 family chitinase